MESNPLLPLPQGMHIEHIQTSENEVQITVIATHPTSCCPLCGHPSCFVHSRYRRRVRDVPCGGRRVQLVLCVRKFFCRNPLCERKVFTERLPELVRPWAQMTIRYFEQITSIGLATCGKGGTRLAARLGIQTTRQSILRHIMALPEGVPESVLYLGIDDFSFRRGCRFGTILVNLETRRVVDLLPDRKADTSATWMRHHPDLMAVSRDRGGDYAAAATASAPQAIQCADRFHVMKNLGEALEGLLARHFAAHRTRVVQELRAIPLPTAQGKGPPKLSPKQAAVSQAKREERLAQYKHVVALRQQGFSQTAIASQVGIGHATVSRWLSSDTFPEQKPRQRLTRLDPYLKAVAERWEAGCHNIAQLHRELVAAGHTLTYRSVYRQLVRYLPEGRKTAASPDQLPCPPVLARQAVFLFLRRTFELSTEEETLALLRSLHAEMDQAYDLVQQFTQMLRERRGTHLDTWLAQVNQSNIPELRSFAAGVEKDKEAVRAGLTWWINNGMVEGHVAKLKLIKRSMYGRAGFPLLRQRVLHAM
ncbi:transposase [Ktedonobacter sp. SOSP1-52]|uniref:ISL3 family transposase n=1 Tax=Ktedonobacter sp. SOSP1-52 TaxID=2778366 RepID=UPI00191533B8|nr:ISL3 family transposase [Ktedonobacter sp. SOSP1-52]GHO63934.1 transposase [Ktedonobacter sp. SOSP1-52]